jgi:hypothetical protein
VRRTTEAMKALAQLAVLFAVSAIAWSCGARVSQEPELDSSGERTGPEVLPDMTVVTALSCDPSWRWCSNDEDCCYGPCRKEVFIASIEQDDSDLVAGACIGCRPAGHKCRNSSECCGRCSRECDIREEDCVGQCFLALAGDLCSGDNECLLERCEANRCQ